MAAFELAKRLEEGGEEVAIVGGIDNPPDLASILGSTQHRILMIDMLPEVTTLTREEAQVFGAKTDHVSLFLSLSLSLSLPRMVSLNLHRTSVVGP